MLEQVLLPAFWIGLGEIIVVNIVLSGDNAVVIAMAARSLPKRLQTPAVVWGSVAAIVMRVILTIAAVELLRLPYLRLIGGVLLLWIAVKLLVPAVPGVPEIVPPADRVNPDGSVPTDTVHEYGGNPPEAPIA